MNVIKYLFTVCVYVAVYVAGHVTDTGLGVHPANVYVYSAVFAFVPLACVGTTPYSTVVVSINELSSFNQVIV